MRLPRLFRREQGPPSSLQAQAQREKVLAEAFRVLGGLCNRMAELLDNQRLIRDGYERPGKYLERLDVPPGGERPPSSGV